MCHNITYFYPQQHSDKQGFSDHIGEECAFESSYLSNLSLNTLIAKTLPKCSSSYWDQM